MKRNRTLQKMLEDYRPDLGDSNEYMEQLQRRLEAVEAVKQLYETERRRTHSQMAVAFALSPSWPYAPLWQQHRYTVF